MFILPPFLRGCESLYPSYINLYINSLSTILLTTLHLFLTLRSFLCPGLPFSFTTVSLTYNISSNTTFFIPLIGFVYRLSPTPCILLFLSSLPASSSILAPDHIHSRSISLFHPPIFLPLYLPYIFLAHAPMILIHPCTRSSSSSGIPVPPPL